MTRLTTIIGSFTMEGQRSRMPRRCPRGTPWSRGRSSRAGSRCAPVPATRRPTAGGTHTTPRLRHTPTEASQTRPSSLTKTQGRGLLRLDREHGARVLHQQHARPPATTRTCPALRPSTLPLLREAGRQGRADRGIEKLSLRGRALYGQADSMPAPERTRSHRPSSKAARPAGRGAGARRHAALAVDDPRSWSSRPRVERFVCDALVKRRQGS